MLSRIDKLAALETTIVAASGGKPFLHPDLEKIVDRIRRNGMIATVISNGYPLTLRRITSLNHAGFDYIQISIDTLNPDGSSKKSLNALEPKLRMLAENADFQVSVNTVMGHAVGNPEDALVIARRAHEIGFAATVGILHDHDGQLQPLNKERKKIYEDILRMGSPVFSFAQYGRFQKIMNKG